MITFNQLIIKLTYNSDNLWKPDSQLFSCLHKNSDQCWTKHAVNQPKSNKLWIYDAYIKPWSQYYSTNLFSHLFSNFLQTLLSKSAHLKSFFCKLGTATEQTDKYAVQDANSLEDKARRTWHTEAKAGCSSSFLRLSLDWLRFYVPFDTKQVISETFFGANLLA